MSKRFILIASLAACCLLPLIWWGVSSLTEDEAKAEDMFPPEQLAQVRHLFADYTRPIPAGRFTMGSAENAPHRRSNEGPSREVQVAAFALGQTEITQAQWQAVMGSNPSHFAECGAQCPVDNISWLDAQAFIKRLNQMLPDRKWRLPSEAEWEYACRAGNSAHQLCGGNAADALAWHTGNSQQKSWPVAQKRPNAFGLYDMSGNLQEWVQDCEQKNYANAPDTSRVWVNGCGARGGRRGLRGGSWFLPAEMVRAAFRDAHDADSTGSTIGLRLAH